MKSKISKTNKLQQSQINEALYEIHRNIASPLEAKKLAKVASYSEQHFHRVFKCVVGETINVYIRRIRLEQAANQLMFDPDSSVLVIAEKCGFISLSSFSQAFKAHFGLTPGQWRTVAKPQAYSPYMNDPEIRAGYERVINCQLPKPEVLELPSHRVAYIRHQGYGHSIESPWILLKSWALEQGCDFGFNNPAKAKGLNDNTSGQQIGLHHSNPAWVPLDQCRYVACLTIDRPISKRGLVNQMTIPGGLHAAFDFKGRYGELLPWLSRILEEWLPSSRYKLKTTPAFVYYRKNHFLSEDGLFDVTIYLPLSLA